MKRFIASVVMVCALSAIATPAKAQQYIFVKHDATGTPVNGTSWEQAYRTLQDALGAVGTPTTLKRIWVARGTYRPDQGQGIPLQDRQRTFTIKAFVEVIGGFEGTTEVPGVFDLNDRDFVVNETILEGDVNLNDTTACISDAQCNTVAGACFRGFCVGDNSFHVVTTNGTSGAPTPPPARINGFTIRAGSAPAGDPGGGLKHVAVGGLVEKSRFESNIAKEDGGALWAQNGTMSAVNCVFSGNRAMRNGGAMTNSTQGRLVVALSQFEDNTAGQHGGAVYVGETVVDQRFVTSEFHDNTAEQRGGGIYFLTNSVPEPEAAISLLANCLFQDNRGQTGGGGVYAERTPLDIFNVRFIANNALEDVEEGAEGHGGGLWVQLDSIFINLEPEPLGDPLPYRVRVVNGLFNANRAGLSGGALYHGGSVENEFLVINSTVHRNLSRGAAGGLFDTVGQETLVSNSVFWMNDGACDEGFANCGPFFYDIDQIGFSGQAPPTVRYSCIQDVDPDDGSVPFDSDPQNPQFNIDDDPLLVDPDGGNGVAGDEDDNLRLGFAVTVSPAIDAGNDADFPGGFSDLDLDNRDRFFSAVDMGAYEVVCSPDGSSCEDGSVCTIDICAAEIGDCTQAPACDDGIACTVDHCIVPDGPICISDPRDSLCSDGLQCTIQRCDGNEGCYVSNMIIYGDATGDGVVDVFDILCVLDGFSGVFTVCSLDDDDIAPCADLDYGDGWIDIFDIVAVLDAFAGMDCCCTMANCGGGAKIHRVLPPAEFEEQSAAKGTARVSVTTGIQSVKARAEPTVSPAAPAHPDPAYRAKTVASDTTVSLVPRSDTIDAGGTVVVDVFADDVKELRGYQLRLTADDGTGAGAGGATIVDVHVDTQRQDFVFAGAGDNVRHAVDRESDRMVVALLSGGATRTARVYLGTFVFKADGSAEGGIGVGIHPSDGMILVDPLGRVQDVPMPAGAEVSVR